MTNWKKLFALVCLFAAGTGFSQVPSSAGTATLQSSDGDPFKLSSGKSFSASGSAAGRRKAISPAAIARQFDEAIEIILQNHVSAGKANIDKLTSSSIDAMLKSLDPHSNFYDADEYQELVGEHESEYSGTGTSIAEFERDGDRGIYVLSTAAGSPAMKAGLRFGDRILAVNGAEADNLSLNEVRSLLRGKRGTPAILTIERAGSEKNQTISVIRQKIHQKSVAAGFFVKDKVGYIDLTGGFSYTTGAEFESALDDLHRQGLSGLVLDLRGNGGGILEQAVKVAEKFLPAGSIIASQRGRLPADTRVWSSGNKTPDDIPLVVLIDGDTASAAEVVAGALQDNDRALMVGTRTFGKGLVQNVLSLDYGTGLTLTAARYYTPSGRSIQRNYDDGSLYDYFNHKAHAAGVGKTAFVAKTMTNRKVYGGDGIAPDYEEFPRQLNGNEAAFIDTAFFFVRQKSANGFDEMTSIEEFAKFAAARGNGNFDRSTINANFAFIQRQVAFNTALAKSGPEAAERVRIASDREVIKAIELLPESAQLSASASAVRGKRGSTQITQ